MNIAKSSVLGFLGAMAISWCCIVTDAAAEPIVGINLTPNQKVPCRGSCAFTIKPLNNNYTRQEVENTIRLKRGIRILINPQTVASPTQWKNTQNMANWALKAGGYVLFCMVDSNRINGVPDTKTNKGHGDGRVDNPAAAKRMWNTVANVYRGDPKVFFEAFNEPFGYTQPEGYVWHMRRIIPDNIPHNRIVLNGMGYAADVQSIKDLWDGLLGYHVYPHYLPEGERIQSNYSNLVQRALAGVAHRTFVTEFGADLTLPDDYNDSSVDKAHVEYLKGMDDAFNVLRPRGTFYYHGQYVDKNNSFSYWNGTDSARRKVDMVQTY